MFHAVPICANCHFFHWREDNDTGYCSAKKQVVDGNDQACSKFNFDPPECRATSNFYQQRRNRRR